MDEITLAEYNARYKPRKASYRSSEADEHIALIEWCQAMTGREPRLRWLFHPANGELRDIKTAVKLKKMGVNPGVPDLWLPIHTRSYAGLAIELKVGNNAASDDQAAWLLHLRSENWYAQVCVGWLAAARLIVWYLDIPLSTDEWRQLQ
jgi:hypothetical protein